MCWSEAFPPGPQGCYCSALRTINCTSICQDTPRDRNNYFEWAMRLCNSRNVTTGDNNSTMANSTTLWPEYANRSAGVYDDMLWQWRLQPGNGTSIPSNTSAKFAHLAATASNNSNANATLAAANSICPSSNASKIYSFAIINGIAAAFTLLARRGFLNQLTRAYFGVPGSRTWPFTALTAVCLNLIATAINAWTALRAPGYGHAQNIMAPSMSTLFLFWSARPRTSWIATLLISVKRDTVEYPAVAASALVAEILQQIIGASVFLGTLIFAAERGYYNVAALTYAPSGSKALTMYVGALAWTVGFAGLLVFVVINWLRRIPASENNSDNSRRRPEHGVGHAQPKEGIEDEIRDPPPTDKDFVPSANIEPGHFDGRANQATIVPHSPMEYEEAIKHMGLSKEIVGNVEKFSLWMLLPFATQWVFWVGYVGLAGDR